VLIPVSAALPTQVGPYIAILAVGFAIGIAGHILRARSLILAGIVIVAGVAVIFGVGVAKLS
jgi:hypothetical protein